MSILDRAEDWILRNTLQPIPSGHPPSDDAPLALLMFTIVLIVTGITCGHCLAR